MAVIKKNFYGYFKESMDSVGLPAPESLWGSITTATATLKVILDTVKSKNLASITLRELALTFPKTGSTQAICTALAEACQVVAMCTAAYYVGACIGAFIYACQMSLFDTAPEQASADKFTQQLVSFAMANGVIIDIGCAIAGNEAAKKTFTPAKSA